MKSNDLRRCNKGSLVLAGPCKPRDASKLEAPSRLRGGTLRVLIQSRRTRKLRLGLEKDTDRQSRLLACARSPEQLRTAFHQRTPNRLRHRHLLPPPRPEVSRSAGLEHNRYQHLSSRASPAHNLDTYVSGSGIETPSTRQMA